jgi:hypothetical protein
VAAARSRALRRPHRRILISAGQTSRRGFQRRFSAVPHPAGRLHG